MKGEKHLIFTEIPLKDLHWTQGKQFWKICQKNSQNVQKRWENYSEEFFSSKRASGHPESSFHNASMEHSSTGSKITAESQKKIKLVVLWNFLHFRKTFLRTCGLQFWQPGQNISLKVCFIRWKVNIDGEFFSLINRLKKHFPPGTKKSVLTTLPNFFSSEKTK